MEGDLGKLFIGGISWDTNSDRLREYFQCFGEVVEAVIMKDRTTGRARGFGFIVFADPAVAERVVMDKHLIDGRMVEAKKAVPREDQSGINRNSPSVHSSPGPARTKKIFVGGLPSSVTDTDFKKYFEQFGFITDVVVMYDHNTQRPRGFGFITFDSEDAVDRALLKNFHELNGKMVEVKRAVPKELSPGSSVRSRVAGFTYSSNRFNSFLNGYTHGYNQAIVGGYGMRMDARFSPVPSPRNNFSSLSPDYGMGMNFESGYGGNSNYNNNVGYGGALSPYFSGNANRYSTSVGYRGGNVNTGSLSSSVTHNVWGNDGLNYGGILTSSSPYMGSRNGSIISFDNNNMRREGSSDSISASVGGSVSGYATANFGFSTSGGGLGRNFGTCNNPFGIRSDGFEGSIGEYCGSSSVYGDPTWRSGTSKLDESDPFAYGFDTHGPVLDAVAKGTGAYGNGYSSDNKQQTRAGIAA